MVLAALHRGLRKGWLDVFGGVILSDPQDLEAVLAPVRLAVAKTIAETPRPTDGLWAAYVIAAGAGEQVISLAALGLALGKLDAAERRVAELEAENASLKQFK